MDCNDANILINKYVDRIITEQEAVLLNGHISQCEACKTEFIFLDEMMTDIAQMPVMTAPDDFEGCVMSCIRSLDHKKVSVFDVYRKAYAILSCVFLAIFGAGFSLITYRENILDYMYTNPNFIALASKMDMLSNDFAKPIQVASTAIFSVVDMVNTTINNASGILIFTMVALCGVQGVILLRGRKIK